MKKKSIHMIAKSCQRAMRILIMEVKKMILFNQTDKTTIKNVRMMNYFQQLCNANLFLLLYLGGN